MTEKINLFRAEIRRHEDQLFGIYLYFRSIELVYAHDPEMVRMTRTHYREIMERGRTAVYDAQILLGQINIGTRQEDDLDDFVFPPIEGHPGLEAMTHRAKVLLECYENLFPQKTRDDAKQLTNDELALLIEKSADRFFGE